MGRLRWIAIMVVAALTIAGCSGSGSGGGAYGVGGNRSAAPAAAPAATAVGGSDGGRGNYGYSTGSSARAGSVAPGTVQLSGFKFQPATLTVAAGSTVSFTNADSVDHAIVLGESGMPAAGETPQPVAPGKTVTIPFAAAGTVKLTCTIHPSMNLTVTVTP